MTRYFITGTDTDCGKTYVSCRLLEQFRAENKKALAIIPLASGSRWQNGELINPDVLCLQKQNQVPSIKICGWNYQLPISPNLAAEQCGEKLSAKAIAKFCEDDAFKN